MDVSIVLQPIVLIAFMIIIGGLLTRTYTFNNDTRALLISLIVNVAMPSIILSSIFNVDIDDDKIKMIGMVFILSLAISLIGIGLGWLITGFFSKDVQKKKEIAVLSGLGNTGFIGIPLCLILFGPEGALYAAIFDAGTDLTIWTVGVLILQKNNKISLKTLTSLINLPTIAIVFGLTTAFLQYKPPFIFVDLSNQLAALAAPLAMFYIGVLMVSLKKGSVKNTSAIITIPLAVKLILLPFVAILLLLLFSVEGLVFQIVLVQSMMPTLTLAPILFSKYNADEEFGAVTTVIGTILALFTIPGLVYLMDIFI